MKKILLIVLIGFLGFFISCSPNSVEERSVKGMVIDVSEGEFNDFKGNFIAWQKPQADAGFWERGRTYQAWFIYPPQEFSRTPFELQLTYKWTQRVSDVPVVRVINLKSTSKTLKVLKDATRQ